MNLSQINAWILKQIKAIEMAAIIVRIISFSLASWMGSETEFFDYS
jgi:hypothetical protein